VIDGWPRALALIAAIGAGVSGGALLAFSTFVMRALRRLPERDGLRAMQEINKAAPQPLFILFLFGTAIVCVVLGVSAATRLDETAARWQLAGCVVYVAATIVTIAWHIPRNDALALVDASAPGAGATWRHYAATWTAWNHVRTAGCITAAVLLTLGFRAG
jgi:uncharacterized membrane protein